MEKSELEVMLALGDFAFFNKGSAIVAASDLAHALAERNRKSRVTYSPESRSSYDFCKYLMEWGDWEVAIVPLTSNDFYVSGAWSPTTTEALLNALVKKKRYSFERKRRMPNAVKTQLSKMSTLTTGFVFDGVAAYTSPLSLYAALTSDTETIDTLVSSEFVWVSPESYYGHPDTTIFVRTCGNLFDRTTVLELLVPATSGVRASIEATIEKIDSSRVDYDIIQCELESEEHTLRDRSLAGELGYDRVLYVVRVCSQMSFFHEGDVVTLQQSNGKTIIDHIVNVFAEAVHEAVASFPSHKTVVIAPRSEQGYLRKNMRVFVPAAKEGTKD